MERERCRGMTVKGRRCKLHAIEGRRFCRHHLPEEQKVRRFMKQHRQEIAALLRDADDSDPVVRELYAVVARQLRRQPEHTPRPKMISKPSHSRRLLTNGQVRLSGLSHASHAHSIGVRGMAIL